MKKSKYVLLDVYFNNPVKYDYIISFLFVFFLKRYFINQHICIPGIEQIMALASETVTILLTLAGFILTFLTVLITFKLDAGKYESKPEEDMSLLEKFSHSGLYFDTTNIFKNSIKSVVFASLLIYFVRILSVNLSDEWVFLITVGGVVILILTLARNLFILDKILEMQKEDRRSNRNQSD